MPLEKGSSRAAISRNISELTHNGSRQRPHAQIVAIALHEADKARRQHRAGGGSLASPSVPFFERNEARSLSEDKWHPGGLFQSDVAGRTDRLPHAVAADSFVFPADVISGLGQGNTMAGSKLMDGILAGAKGPYGTNLSRVRRADGGDAPGVSHVLVAGGEYLAPRHALQNVGWRRHGGKHQDPKGDLSEGQKWAREMVAKVRGEQKKFLASAPKPKR